MNEAHVAPMEHTESTETDMNGQSMEDMHHKHAHMFLQGMYIVSALAIGVLATFTYSLNQTLASGF